MHQATRPVICHTAVRYFRTVYPWLTCSCALAPGMTIHGMKIQGMKIQVVKFLGVKFQGVKFLGYIKPAFFLLKRIAVGSIETT